LEAIIRIRLDRLSGTLPFSKIELEDGEEATVTSDDYGILESLFILRLSSALKATARKIAISVDELMSIYEQTGSIPSSKNMETGQEEPSYDDQLATVSECDNAQKGATVQKILSVQEKQRIIEDSFMSLFNDNSEILDLQIQTQRNSSIIDSHIMSGLLGIIDLPRKRLGEELKKESQGTKAIASGPSDKIRSELFTLLGVSKGVGAVSILAFTLALFTIKEDYLLGLLSKLEYEKMLKEFSGSNVVLASTKTDTLLSVNELSKYIKFSYDIFESELAKSDSLFALTQQANSEATTDDEE
jgi:hypothetical protein